MNKPLRKLFIFVLFFSFRESFNFIESESLFPSLFSDFFENERRFTLFSDFFENERRFRSEFRDSSEQSNLFSTDENDKLIKFFVQFPKEIKSEDLLSLLEKSVFFENNEIKICLKNENLFLETFISNNKYNIKFSFSSKNLKNDWRESISNRSMEEKKEFGKKLDLEKIKIDFIKNRNLLKIEIPFSEESKKKDFNGVVPIEVIKK